MSCARSHACASQAPAPYVCNLNGGFHGMCGLQVSCWQCHCVLAGVPGRPICCAYTGSFWGQGLLAPVADAPECGRPRNATCGAQLPHQACTGRISDAGDCGPLPPTLGWFCTPEALRLVQWCQGFLFTCTTALVTGGMAVACVASVSAGRVVGSGGRKGARSELVERAHQRGLVVHAYTFRNEVRGLVVHAYTFRNEVRGRAACRRRRDNALLRQGARSARSGAAFGRRVRMQSHRAGLWHARRHSLPHMWQAAQAARCPGFDRGCSPVLAAEMQGGKVGLHVGWPLSAEGHGFLWVRFFLGF